MNTDGPEKCLGKSQDLIRLFPFSLIHSYFEDLDVVSKGVLEWDLEKPGSIETYSFFLELRGCGWRRL